MEFAVEKKFMMVDRYFNHERYALPLLLKKIAGETEQNHKRRVKMYLLACPDSKFADIAELINPESVF